MKWMKSVGEFEAYLRMEHYADNTVRSYLFAVRQFFWRYKTVSDDHLNRYKLWLLEEYKPQTVNQRICALNQYVTWLRECGGYELPEQIGKLRRLRQVKLQQKFFLEHTISDSEFTYLKNCLLKDGNYRWYYLLRLLAASGARISELLQLKYEHLEAGYMEICSKAGKTRRILIPRGLCLEAMEYYRGEGITSGFLLRNLRGQVISARGVNAGLKCFASRYGLNEKTMHPHAFRHLYAQNFLKKCPDLALLADLLGHDSIETTRIYLKKTGLQQQKLINEIVTW